MATATIYKLYVYESYNIRETGSHWNLEPWGGDVPGCRGEDDGGALYELPEGFTVGEVAGGPEILDKSGYPCSFADKSDDEHVTFDNFDTPHIVDGNGKTYVLEKA